MPKVAILEYIHSSGIDLLKKNSAFDFEIIENISKENLINKIKDNNYILLTTEKDYFRISENHKKNIKCLKIKVEIENKNQFIEEIKKII